MPIMMAFDSVWQGRKYCLRVKPSYKRSWMRTISSLLHYEPT